RGAGQTLGVPADMLAGEIYAGVRSIKPEHLAILLEHRRELLVEARVGPMSSAAKLAHHLSEKPGSSIGAATDHHAIGTGLTQRLARILDRANVAIDDHRHRHGFLDVPDEAPVSLSLVHLAARAAMDRD